MRLIWLALLAAVLAPVAAVAAPSLRIAETSPALPASLANDEPLYLRVTYSADVDGLIEVRALRAGRDVTSKNGGMIPVKGGMGEGLAWVSFPPGEQIDAIRLTLKNDHGDAVHETVQPVSAVWTGAERSAASPREWVSRLRAERQSAYEDSAGGNMLVGWLFGLAVLGSMIGYVFLQIRLPRLWDGGWRIAAVLPLVGTVGFLIWSLIALADGSNLWPLLLLLYLPVAFVYLLVLATAKALVRGTA
ncbi:hypothetical protein [Sphingomonas arenae]|uniref:hypothetical protein n=1 Tax=Sphingomonas arenae TaxID=2812555 RepID=UPI00196867F6|nr:hypothetical protein [Sphingomonas arenae]